jgi:ABC-2 type transport system permease protein
VKKMSRTLRHGGYASLMLIIVVAAVVAMNLLADQIPWKADLTQNRVFSLSQETLHLLSGLKTDITITTVGKQGSDDPTVAQILKKYALASRHVQLQSVDPDRSPGWARQYDPAGTVLREGALLVAGGKRFKAVDRFDLYTVDYSNPNQGPRVTGISVEQRVSSAIQYVTADRNVTLYALQGHGETGLSALDLATPVANDNYETKDITLLTAAAVPADADILLVVAPKTDLSAQDAEKIRTYLASGGRAALFLDLPAMGASLPNLDDLLKSYGLSMRRLIVMEGDPSRVAFGNPLFLLPRFEKHDILAPLTKSDLPVLVPGSQAIDTLSLKKRSLKVEPLLTTTARSWGKTNYGKITSAERESGDTGGPFTLAMAVTEPAADGAGRDARLVVVGSSGLLVKEVAARAPGNVDFFMNALGWLREKKDTLTIRPKSLQTFPLRMNALQSLLLSGFVVIVMPLVILGWGFAVWMRRRHL